MGRGPRSGASEAGKRRKKEGSGAHAAPIKYKQQATGARVAERGTHPQHNVHGQRKEKEDRPHVRAHQGGGASARHGRTPNEDCHILDSPHRGQRRRSGGGHHHAGSNDAQLPLPPSKLGLSRSLLPDRARERSGSNRAQPPPASLARSATPEPACTNKEATVPTASWASVARVGKDNGARRGGSALNARPAVQHTPCTA